MLGASTLDALLGVVWLLISMSEVILFVRLASLRLLSVFKLFAIYLAADVLRSSLLHWLGSNPYSEVYRNVWVTSEPILLLSQCLVVFELYRALYRAYPGIHTFARVLIAAAVGMALLITFGTVHFDIGHITWQIPDLQRLFAAKRLVSSLLGILVLITMIFFPRTASARNILLHGWLLAALFIVAAGGLFVANSGATTEWPSLVFLTLQFVCFLAWIFCLQRNPPPPSPMAPEEVERIIKWNDELLEVARWLTRKDTP